MIRNALDFLPPSDVSYFDTSILSAMSAWRICQNPRRYLGAARCAGSDGDVYILCRIFSGLLEGGPSRMVIPTGSFVLLRRILESTLSSLFDLKKYPGNIVIIAVLLRDQSMTVRMSKLALLHLVKSR
jgi:hypothetical protein